MKADMFDLMCNPPVVATYTNSFADCVQAPAEPKKKCGLAFKKKEEVPMSSLSSATVITADSIEKDQRRFIVDRLNTTLYYIKRYLKRQFGLADDVAPKTVEEMLARIAAGKYVLPEKHKDLSPYCSVSYIRWRDPSVKEDKDGYLAARKALEDEFSTAEEAARLLPIAEATKAMQDFKSWKYIPLAAPAA